MYCTNHTKQADQVGADRFTGGTDPVHRGFPSIWDNLKIKYETTDVASITAPESTTHV